MSFFQRMTNGYRKAQASFLLIQGTSLEDTGQFQAAEALRTAMLLTKQRYDNPVAWAAFTLIGEASTEVL